MLFCINIVILSYIVTLLAGGNKEIYLSQSLNKFDIDIYFENVNLGDRNFFQRFRKV